ncbi:MAG TPA: zinc-binding dehydrogenase [bacterium]|nr:zinc-binding dehydrogenase [bacterium]
MRAALFHGPGKPLTVQEVETPKIGPGEALVKVAACGVCATDLHYLHGTPTFKKPPLILGHEVSGRIEAVAPDIKGLAPGESVLVPAVLSCGECLNCRRGRDNLCERMVMPGNHADGGFAEFLKVPARTLVPLPPGLPLLESAVISDAVSTPFHAVRNRGHVQGGDWVAIFGCGGVGINAVQIAAALGATVIAVDVDPKKLAQARELGAAEALNAKEGDVPKTIRKLTGGGVDVAFEIVGKPQVLDQALGSVRAGGTLVAVGYSEEPWTFAVHRVMFREMSVLGSLGCPSADYPTILQMVLAGKIRLEPVVGDRLPLDQVNEALARLEAGTVAGRQLIVP